MTRISGRFWLSVLALTAGCGGGDSNSPNPGGKVSLDPSAAVHDSVTVVGKVLTATSHGVTYTLTIPAGALQVPTVITMTPVTSIDGLGVTQFLGAVDLQPQGLVLGRSATLRITNAHPAPSGTVLLGFGYEGDADSLARLLPVDSAGGVNLSIHHFSGGGAAFATFGEIQTLAPVTGTLQNQDQFYLDSLFNLVVLDPRDFLAEPNLMRGWFAGVVLPSLQNASTDIQLLFAMSEYDFWRRTQTPGNLIPDDPLFASERSQFAAAALAKLQEAVFQNNVACETGRDIRFANNVLYWQSVAEQLGLATAGNGLDRDGILADLCLHVRITDSSYPDPVQPAQTGTLDMLAGLQFANDPVLSNQLFTWTLDISGSTADGTTQGLSAADGSFQRTVIPTGSAPLIIAFKACLFAAEVPYSDVCSSGLINRNFGGCDVVVSGDLTVNSPTSLLSLTNVREVTGNLRLQGGVGAVDLLCLRRVDGALTITGATQTPWQGPGIVHLPALDSVGVFAVDGGAVGVFGVELPDLHFSENGGGVGNAPDLQDIVLPSLVTSGELDFVNNPSLRTVTLGDLEALKLVFRGNTALTSISVGNVTLAQAGVFFITSNPALTSTTVASLAGTDPVSLEIQSNGSLSSLSGFSSNTTVSGFFFDLLNGFDEGGALGFANRITTAGVCQTQPASQITVKCYQGPPWH